MTIGKFITFSTISVMIFIFVSCSRDEEKDNSFNTDNHEYVDLGLPSGTLWATCNIGANKPEEYGLYFAWGETIGYSIDTLDNRLFDWDDYKWSNGLYSVTKYISHGWGGTGDHKSELDSEDDVATVIWGKYLCMPSDWQMEELCNSSYTSYEWIAQNGVNGIKITSKTNGKYLFFPAAGCRGDSRIVGEAGFYGGYWSRSRYSRNDIDAYGIHFYSERFGLCVGERCWGFTVRPVRAFGVE